MSEFSKFFRGLFGGSPQGDSEDLRKELEALKATNADLAKRLESLDKSVWEVNKHVWDAHKWFTSILTGVIGIVFSVVFSIGGCVSYKNSERQMEKMESDLNRKTDEMHKAVKQGLDDMDRKFERLAGDALKRPLLYAVTQDGQFLDGKTNLLFNEGYPQIYSLFLTNAGERRSDPISITISIQPLCRVENDQDWDTVRTGDTNFASSFFSKRTTTTIAPGQMLNVPPLAFGGCQFASPVRCELEVFYGRGEERLKTRFYIKSP